MVFSFLFQLLMGSSTSLVIHHRFVVDPGRHVQPLYSAGVCDEMCGESWGKISQFKLFSSLGSAAPHHMFVLLSALLLMRDSCIDASLCSAIFRSGGEECLVSKHTVSGSCNTFLCSGNQDQWRSDLLISDD